ncbi:Variable outer membrane protein [Borrelia duttonii CR2A]|uniref:Variable large protein n=1 Tax=Borrelia duttonii CR2A TaxID=1432657 RepID=W6TGR3_9SPIR|nr:Variable outer membrane protein [Borrelia duttonii CR2A]
MLSASNSSITASSFTKIENRMKRVKVKLGEIIEENGNYEKVKEKVEEFVGKIGKIEEGAKEAAGGASGDVIGNAKKGEDAKPAEVASVNKLVKGIKEIVGVVLKNVEGDPNATKTAEEQQKSIGKLLGEKTNGGTEQQAAATSATIGAVIGVDILKAIASSAEAGTGEIKIEEAKNTVEIVASKKEDNKEFGVDSVKKDAVIAGGIALRGMAKEGKFAAKNGDDGKHANAINGAVASAVNKVLSTLIIAIRNKVDEGLKEINKVLGEIKQGEGSESTSN